MIRDSAYEEARKLVALTDRTFGGAFWRMIYTIENFIKGVAQVMRSEAFLESLAQDK